MNAARLVSLVLGLLLGSAVVVRGDSLDEADRLWAAGEPGRAIALVESLDHADRPDAAVLLSLGSMYQRVGAAHRALEPLTTALAMARDSGNVEQERATRYYLGMARLDLHDYAGAELLLSTAMERDPDDAQAPYVLGWVMLRAGRFDEAVDAFEEAERRGSDWAAADRDYALEQQAGLRDLLAADRLANRLILVSLVLAVIAYAAALYWVRRRGLALSSRAGSAAVAVALLVGVGAAAPRVAAQDAAQWKGFEEGYQLYQRGDLAGARDALHANIDRYPEYGPNHYGLALVEFAEGRGDRARRQLEICLAKLPEYGPARMRLIRQHLDERRRDEAVAVLDWFGPDVPKFDEQVDHFRSAATVNEDIGRHPEAFACALEAWRRDIGKWVEGSRKEPETEPRIDYAKRDVAAVLWLLAVNSWMAASDQAAHWRTELERVPSVQTDGVPFEFDMLAVARDFRRSARDDFAGRLCDRLLADTDDAGRTLEFLLRWCRQGEGTAKERAPGAGRQPRPLRRGGPRDYVVYFERELGESLASWRRFLGEELPTRLRADAELCRDAAPGRAARLVLLAARLGGEETAELLLYVAECYHADGDHALAIELLDRALKMKPPYGYKYRKLREKCERELRRFRPRR